MKSKLLRFGTAFGLVLLAAALPLWLLWRRAEAAREQALELSGRFGEAARQNISEKRDAAAQRMALLESAPVQLAGESFLEWESFCAERPWDTLRPVLDKRLAENSGTDEVRTLLLIRWAGEDGAAAAAWAGAHLPEKNRAFSNTDPDLSSLGATWAWHDPAGFSRSPKGDRAGQRTMGKWLAPRDAALAFEMVRRPFDPAEDWTRDAAEIIAPFLKTPSEAKTLLERVSKEKHEKDDPPINYTTKIFHAWADMDEAGALAAAAAYPGEDNDTLVEEVIHYAMRGRPQTEATADEWLERLPPNLRREGMNEIVTGLMSVDTAAAGRWLLRQDPAMRQIGMLAYFDAMTWRDPVAALVYAYALTDTGRDDAPVPRMVWRWAALSPAAATELLQNQGWSEARISQLKDRVAVQYPQAAQWWWDW